MLYLFIFLTLLADIAFAPCYAQKISMQPDQGIESHGSLPLYYWHENKKINFGDYLSLKLVERIVGLPVQIYEKKPVVVGKKLLALGSILYFARENDIVWGSGINGKRLIKEEYSFTSLDIRSVRGPLSRAYLIENFNLSVPEIYGDPALLFPYLFPEFKKKENPSYDYIVIPHYLEEALLPKTAGEHIIHPTEPWNAVIEKILDSKFVISGSLHGLIVAEAYGIPAKWLRISEKEPVFKFYDYYLGTNRHCIRPAFSIKEALEMGGDTLPECDLKKLYEAFPFECWPGAQFANTDLLFGSNDEIAFESND